MSNLTIGHGTPIHETKGMEYLKNYKCLCGCTEFVTVFIDDHRCEICKRCIDTENGLKNIKKIYELNNEI